jgi:serine/threonine protein kinase
VSREEEPRLLELADRIGGRRAIDWQREFLASSDASELSLLQSLHTLARIRSLHAEGAESPPQRWGRLTIVGEIGRGSFGQVLRAHDPNLQRDVALKLLDRQRVQGEDERVEVLREARCLARIRHENVVSVHGVEEHDGRIGLWMELIEGKNLATILSENGPWGEGELRHAGSVLARAVAAVHREGILHRDIKPQNIVREAGGRLVLMDLGAGSRSDATTQSPIGTPMYLAPELLAGQAASVASDIYALGVTLFHLASGRFPVEADSIADLHAAQRGGAGRRVRLADLRPELSPSLLAIIERCLTADPNQRWQSAGELALELAAPPSRSPRHSSRRRLWLSSAAVLALLTVLAWASREVWLRPARFDVDAAVFRWTQSGREELDPGARLSVDDAIGLRLRSDRDLYVYVLNEDDAGRTRLLFPLPWLQLRNPLPAMLEHRLPGVVDGEERAWAMSERAAQERLVVVASASPLPELEEWIATLPAAASQDGEALLEGASLRETRRRLRGLGRVVSVPTTEQPPRFGSLGELEALLRGPQQAHGLWVRRFEYQTAP